MTSELAKTVCTACGQPLEFDASDLPETGADIDCPHCNSQIHVSGNFVAPRTEPRRPANHPRVKFYGIRAAAWFFFIAGLVIGLLGFLGIAGSQTIFGQNGGITAFVGGVIILALGSAIEALATIAETIANKK